MTVHSPIIARQSMDPLYLLASDIIARGTAALPYGAHGFYDLDTWLDAAHAALDVAPGDKFDGSELAAMLAAMLEREDAYEDFGNWQRVDPAREYADFLDWEKHVWPGRREWFLRRAAA